MNPLTAAIVTLTASSLVVKAYDDGKTNSPPTKVISVMLTAASSSSDTAASAMTNAITGEIYWMRGEHVPPLDAKK